MPASDCKGLTPLIFFETFSAVGFRDFLTRFGISLAFASRMPPTLGDVSPGLYKD
jgi:hypothetical protein